MRTVTSLRVLTFAMLVFCAPAFANVGATSAGVTTTDPTQPSENVQQQSSTFVQANAQLAASGNAGANPANRYSSTARNGNKAAVHAAGKNGGRTIPGQPGAAGEDKTQHEHAPPPKPPAPPPVYRSVIRPLNRPPSNTNVADAAPPRSRESTKPATGAKVPARQPASKPLRSPGTSRQAKHDAGAIKVPAYQADTGGRGSAPDGYAFPLGLLIAGLLLAFGLSTYLRIGRSESRRNRQT